MSQLRSAINDAIAQPWPALLKAEYKAEDVMCARSAAADHGNRAIERAEQGRWEDACLALEMACRLEATFGNCAIWILPAEMALQHLAKKTGQKRGKRCPASKHSTKTAP